MKTILLFFNLLSIYNPTIANTIGDSISQKKIFPPEININMNFGYSVAMKDSFFAVGAPNNIVSGISCGSVFIYKYLDTNYLFIQKIYPSDGVNDDKFGHSLCFSSLWFNQLFLFVGAPNKLISNRRCGAVYVYKLVNSEFIYIKKLTPLSPSNGDGFGFSIASHSDRLVVGAPTKKFNDTICGAIYYHIYWNNDWAYFGYLIPLDKKPNQRFGYSVATRSNRVFIGAPGDNTYGNNAGAVYDYFFIQGPNTWEFNMKKYSLSPKAGDEFGFSLTTGVGNGQRIVVGSPGIDENYIDAGKIFIYNTTGYSFGLIKSIQSNDPQPGDKLGYSVHAKIYNEDLLRIFVGAPFKKTVPNLETGCTYLFGSDNYTANQLFKVTPQNIYGSDNYGFSVTIAGDYFIAGAPNNSETDQNVGAVYFHKFIPAVPIPVELNSFSAQFSRDKVLLTWQTVSELNNFGFEVERSDDNKNWITRGFVKGAGTSTELNNYSFTDELYHLNSNKLYYRLKQLDFNGKQNYSDVLEVNVVTPEFILFQNYPNPFNPTTKISWQSPISSWQTLKIYDVLGNEVATLVDEFREAGRYEVEFNAVETRRGVSLPSGVYFYQLRVTEPSSSSGKGFVETKKMILTK
jgi:hypothetical protein